MGAARASVRANLFTVICLGYALLGCAASGGPPPGNTGSGGAGGGTGTGAGTGGTGPAVGGATQPPLTDCGIVQQLRLEPSALAEDPQVQISRAGDGFVLVAAQTTGSSPSLSFARASAAGALGVVTTIPAESAPGQVVGVAGRALPGDQLLLLTLADGAFPLMQLFISALDAGATAVGPAQALFSTNLINQNGMVVAARSFDGLHTVLAAGSPVEGQPVAGLVGADGRLVGQAVTVATTWPDMLWENMLVTPTAHGGAISVTDQMDGAPRWRIVELDGSGAVTLDASMPLPDGLPPYVIPHLVAASPRGFAAVVLLGSDGPMALTELDRTGSAAGGPAITRTSTVSSSADVSALGPLGSDFLLAFSSTDMATLRLGRLQSDGTIHAVNVPLPDAQSYPGWIPAEGDGLTFWYRTTDGVAIVKVSCPP